MIAVGAAVVVGLVFTVLVFFVRPRADLWDWFIALVATGVSALFAVGVFEYQSRQAENDRLNNLLAALAAELQSNVDILRSEHRTPFFGRVRQPNGETGYAKLADAKLVPLPPVAINAAISSGVFDANDVYLLTRYLRELHVHDGEVSHLESIRSNPAPIHADTILVAVKELDERQDRIAAMCEELIEFLREHEGIEVPGSPDQEARGDTN